MTDNIQFGTIDYGRDHHHKPTKAIIGIAVMVVLAFGLYEFNGNSAHNNDRLQSSSTAASQTVASSNHH